MDTLIKWLTGVVVVAVAVFAAWISYNHLYDLSHHQPLLPLCVDGMMIAASLVLLAAERAKLEPIPLARVTLWAGILGTIAGNLAYGLPLGWLGAVVSTWPAVCLVLTVETVMQLAKARRKRRVRTPVAATVLASKEPVYAKATVDRMAKRGVATPKQLPNKGKVPGIKVIRKTLRCGQPVAYEVQAVMVRGLTDDIVEAKKIRDKEKDNGNQAN